MSEAARMPPSTLHRFWDVMEIDGEFLSQYILELYSAKSLDERFQAYERFIIELGFSGAVYTFAPRMHWEIMVDIPYIFLHTKDFPIGFLQDYGRKRLDRKDFTIRKILQGDTSLMDWRENELHGDLNADEISLIRYARDQYNIKNAISIPTILEEKGAAGASVISFKDDHIFKILKEKNLGSLVSITRLFHDSNVSDLGKFILPLFNSLTEKEITILNYKASGKHMKTIYDYTGITENYASNVLSTLRRRLGHINNDRLMYLFGLLNSVTNIPERRSPLET